MLLHKALSLSHTGCKSHSEHTVWVSINFLWCEECMFTAPQQCTHVLWGNWMSWVGDLRPLMINLLKSLGICGRFLSYCLANHMRLTQVHVTLVSAMKSWIIKSWNTKHFSLSNNLHSVYCEGSSKMLGMKKKLTFTLGFCLFFVFFVCMFFFVVFDYKYIP